MPYIIDGHNLIGAIEDIDLSEDDDEARLIVRLQSFSHRVGKRFLVYFDRGQPGGGGPGDSGNVKVIFVPQPRTADDAIEAKLQELGGEARNWTLVSSDRRLIGGAQRAGARFVRSEEFARELASSIPDEIAEDAEEEIDVEYWQSIFNQGRSDEDERGI